MNRFRHFLGPVSALTLLLAACFASAGCPGYKCGGVDCEPCPPPLTLHLREAFDRPFAGEVAITVTKITGTLIDVAAWCETVGSEVICTAHPSGDLEDFAGTYRVRLTSAGRRDEDFEINVPADESDGCCSCGYEPVDGRVQMSRPE